MLASLAVALLFQGQVPKPIPAPVLPPGVNRSFQEAAATVIDFLARGDFSQAKVKMKALPRIPVIVDWDDTKVDPSLRPTYADYRDRAFKMWSGNTKVSARVGVGAGLKFKFVDQLQPGELGIPQGAAHIFSTSPYEPRLTVSIALNRGNPLNPTMPNEIQNEVAHSIALYLGLERSMRAGSVSFRTDLSGSGLMPVGARESYMADETAKVVSDLQSAIDKQQRLVAAKPQIFLEKTTDIVMPPVLQGEPQSFSIQVTNNGTGTMTLFVEPDCGCLIPIAPPQLEAGNSGVIMVHVNTIEYVGKMRKWLYVYSNDADFPMRQIPIDVEIKPLYRLIMPGPNTLQMGDDGLRATAYLWFGEGSASKPTEVRLDGIRGDVAVVNWEGNLADPEMGEEAKPRKGYKIVMDMPSVFIPARATSSLVVTTDHPIFRTLRLAYGVQRGIVPIPERVYFGEITKSAQRGMFILSQPETDFKITKIESSLPGLSAIAKPLKGNWEYRVDVALDGTQDFGSFRGLITIYTDSPLKPVIQVPIEATVK